MTTHPQTVKKQTTKASRTMREIVIFIAACACLLLMDIP